MGNLWDQLITQWKNTLDALNKVEKEIDTWLIKQFKEIKKDPNLIWYLFFGYVLILFPVYWILTLFFEKDAISNNGQLLADWIFFPAAILGFFLAIREFRLSQAKPKLEAFWSGDAGVSLVDKEGNIIQEMVFDEEKNEIEKVPIELEKVAFLLQGNKHTDTHYTLRLHVQNMGELVIIWYRIAFDLPRQLFRLGEEIYEFKGHLGDEDNWGENDNMARRQYEFKSNGKHALYPDQSVHLCTLTIKIPANYIKEPRQGFINYSIVTDQTKLEYKQLPLHISPDLI